MTKASASTPQKKSPKMFGPWSSHLRIGAATADLNGMGCGKDSPAGTPPLAALEADGVANPTTRNPLACGAALMGAATAGPVVDSVALTPLVTRPDCGAALMGAATAGVCPTTGLPFPFGFTACGAAKSFVGLPAITRRAGFMIYPFFCAQACTTCSNWSGLSNTGIPGISRGGS
jgi:hypothetical protein